MTKVAILYQSDGDGQKDYMGLSLDIPLMFNFEDYLNKVQKYNFFSEDVLVNDYAGHLESLTQVEGTNVYLNAYLIPYFERFVAENKQIQ